MSLLARVLYWASWRAIPPGVTPPPLPRRTSRGLGMYQRLLQRTRDTARIRKGRVFGWHTVPVIVDRANTAPCPWPRSCSCLAQLCAGTRACPESWVPHPGDTAAPVSLCLRPRPSRTQHGPHVHLAPSAGLGSARPRAGVPSPTFFFVLFLRGCPHRAAPRGLAHFHMIMTTV